MNLDNFLSSTDLLQQIFQTRNNSIRFPIDVINDEKYLYIICELPGVTKESISIEFINNRLIIKAEKKQPYHLPETKNNISEIQYGKLERTINLAFAVTKPESVSSNYTRGFLSIKVDKSLEQVNRFTVQPNETD